MSRNKWYWTLQITGWSLYGLLGLVINGIFEAPSISVVVFALLSAAFMLIATHFLRYLIRKYEWLRLPFLRLSVRLLLTSVGLAFLINVLNSVFIVYIANFFGEEKFSVAVFFLYVFQTTIYFALWLGIYVGVYYFRNYKREEIEKWKLQSAVKDAELIALKAQINPHFLFNALNNIRALILEDQMKARDMVSHLSDLLRYSIQFNDQEKVTIAEELEIVNNYLELESIHYEKRLSYEINSPDRLKNYKIPPMVIQLMVENAVKHGISQVKSGGNIIVNVSQEDIDLTLCVSNTGSLEKKPEKGGIGIRNAIDRINLLFDQEPEFKLEQQGRMVTSTLKLPKEK